MPTLRFRAAALRDLAQIAEYIARESGDRGTGEALVDRLIAYCERIGALPQEMGRSRQEVRDGYRSVTFGSYVIFFRYIDADGPRSHLYVGNVIHGRRDLDAFFSAEDGEPDDD